jgi:hypothetical protein
VRRGKRREFIKIRGGFLDAEYVVVYGAGGIK